MFDIVYLMDAAWAYLKYKGKLRLFLFSPSSIRMYKVEETLNKYGVNIYGRKLEPNGYRSFLVPEVQAKYAEYLCFAAGFSKVGTHYSENEKYRGRGLPKRQWQKSGRRKNFLFQLGRLLKLLS